MGQNPRKCNGPKYEQCKAFIHRCSQENGSDGCNRSPIYYETNITNIRFGRTDTQNKTVGVVNIGASINRRDDEVEVSLRHLKDLMFFDEVVHNPGWYVNATTREFLRACYPEMQATAP